MKLIVFTIFAMACVSAWNKTIVENLEANVKDFSDSLKTANAALFDTLNTTSECPCRVFSVYAIEQIPTFVSEYTKCQTAGNQTEIDKCIVDTMCTPFKTLTDNSCAGFFNKSIATTDPEKATMVQMLLSECEKLTNETITINDTCKEIDIVDYTVFAINSSVADKDLIEYHVIKGAYTVENLSPKNFVQSVYNDSKARPQFVEVVVGANNSVRVVTDFIAQTYANVTATYSGSNGFVHLLTSAMSLPKSPSEVLSGFPSLSNLSAEVTKQGVNLDDAQVLTLLAPVDAGFANFPFFMNLTDELQVLTLESHVLNSSTALYSTDVVKSNGTIINTTSGMELRIQVVGDSVGFVAPEDSRDLTYVVVADVLTSNGVIHLVDAVLRPIKDTASNNVVDNLFLDERLSSFASLIVDSAPEFVTFLRTATDVTVFAPQNLSSASMLGITELQALLDYHTLPSEILAGQLKPGQNVVDTSLSDKDYVRLDGGNQSLIVVANNGSVQLHSTYASKNVDVTFPNIVSANKVVIHVISSPAQIPVSTIETLHAGKYDFLADSFANNTEMAKLVNGYPNAFNNDTEKWTIFAAKDSAYSKLSSYANDTEVSVMQNQVLRGRALSGDIIDLLKTMNSTNITLEMLSGRNVTLELKDDSLYVDGWKVIEADVLTANGVIHILDGAIGETSSSDGLSAGVLAAIIVGGVAFLGLLCYCFFMKGDDGSSEESQPFARIP